ncbi:MAG: hypothetical protein ABIC95_06640 [archaeon]
MKQQVQDSQENAGRLPRDVALVLGIITGFMFIVSFSAYYVYDAINKGTVCGCVLPVPVMMLILASLGVFVGSTIFFLMSRRHMKDNRTAHKAVEKALLFLAPDERQVVHVLAEEKGRMRQAAFESKTGLGRVKVHRIVKRLEEKGVINRVPEGNSLIISLDSDLAQLLI